MEVSRHLTLSSNFSSAGVAILLVKEFSKEFLARCFACCLHQRNDKHLSLFAREKEKKSKSKQAEKADFATVKTEARLRKEGK